MCMRCEEDRRADDWRVDGGVDDARRCLDGTIWKSGSSGADQSEMKGRGRMIGEDRN